ncbi:MAG: ABC transporter ATP-binding protein/permease [Arachnia sp.]
MQQTRTSLGRAGRATLSAVWAVAPGSLIVSTVAALALGAVPPLQLWLVGQLVSAVADGGDFVRIAPPVVAMGLLLGIMAGINSLLSAATKRLEFRVSAWAQDRLLLSAGSQSPAVMENPAERDALEADWETARSRMAPLLMNLFHRVGQVVTIVGTIIVVSQISILGTLFLIGAAIPPLFAVPMLFRVHSKAYEEAAALDRVTASLGVFAVSADGFMDSVVSHYQAALRRTHGEFVRRSHEQQLHATNLEARVVLVSAIATAACVIAAFFAMLNSGNLTAGGVAVAVASVTVLGALTEVVFAAGELVRDSLLVARLVKRIDSAREPRRAARTQPLGVEGVAVTDVSFTYLGAETPALADVSTEFATGTVTCVVGRNGSGKSTLLKLLAGVYEPTVGSVLPVGSAEPLNQLSTSVLQGLPQPPILLREYLTGDRAITDQTIFEHARLLGIDFLTDSMLGSRIGREFRDGFSVSGGQWQKLAVLRLVLSPEPIWLLDEPSSALDPEGELQILDALRSLAGDRLVVLVSHRASTALRADRVIMMDHGSIVLDGPPAQVSAAPAFTELFSAQLL